MRLLIAVKSCHRDANRGDHKSIENTWWSDAWHAPADCKFFLGESPFRQYFSWSDEVYLDCKDGYDSLPDKTRNILKWSIAKDYDYTFLCDTDTYLIPRLLLTCGFEKYDIAGRFGQTPALGTTFIYKNDGRGNRIDNCHPWPSGGVGYFLSKKAAQVVVNTEPMSWAEDLYVGQVLGPKIQSGEIIGKDLEDFEGRISWHFPRRDYDNKSYDPVLGWMEKMYKEYR